MTFAARRDAVTAARDHCVKLASFPCNPILKDTVIPMHNLNMIFIHFIVIHRLLASDIESYLCHSSS